MKAGNFASRMTLVVDAGIYLMLLACGVLLIFKNWDFALRHAVFLGTAVLLGMGIVAYLFWCYRNDVGRFVGVNVFFFMSFVSIGLLELFFHHYPGMIPSSIQPCVDYRIVAPLQTERLDKQEFVVKEMIGTHYPFADIEYPLVAETEFGTEDVQSVVIHVRMDEMGLRNQKGVHSDGQKPDIVVVGDSYAHGLGVRQNWSDILGKEIDLRVVNLSLGGGAPQHWADMLRYSYIDERGAKIILVTFWDNNDFSDAVRYDDVKKTGGDFADYWAGLGFRGAYEIRNTLHRWLASNSVLFGAMKAVRNVSFERDGDEKEYDVLLDDGQVDVRMRFRRGVPAIRPDERGWKMTERALLDVKDIADKVGARVVLLYFSVNSNLYYRYMVERDEYIETNRNNYQTIGGMLKKFCEGHGVGFVDIAAGLEKDAGRYPILQTHHYTEIGHEFVGKVVGRHITETRLFDRKSKS